MVQIQKVLEHALYVFGQKALPHVLVERGWDCPELGELNKWTKVLKRQPLLDNVETNKTQQAFLQSIERIRHTAVHRLRTSSRGLEQFLADAEAISKVLGDTLYSEAVSQLRVETQAAIDELTQNKRFLQLRLVDTQTKIAKQRAELDQLERETIASIRKSDAKYQRLAGEKLERTLELVERSVAVTSMAYERNGERIDHTDNYTDSDGDEGSDIFNDYEEH